MAEFDLGSSELGRRRCSAKVNSEMKKHRSEFLPHFITSPFTFPNNCLRLSSTDRGLTDDLLLVALGEELHGGGGPPRSLEETLTLRVLSQTPQDGGVGGGQRRQAHLVVFHAAGALLPPALHHRGGRPLRAGLGAGSLGSRGGGGVRALKVSVEDGATVAGLLLVAGTSRGLPGLFHPPTCASVAPTCCGTWSPAAALSSLRSIPGFYTHRLAPRGTAPIG